VLEGSKDFERINGGYHHLMRFNQLTNLFPVAGKIYFQLNSALLLQFEINYFRRRFGLNDPIKIVGVARNDYQVIFKGIIPNGFIGISIAPIMRKRKIGGIEPGEFAGRLASTRNFIRPPGYSRAGY
jgi:hypothetical protein